MNRHDLLYLDYDSCKAQVCCLSTEKDLVMNWIQKGNPFIITKQFSNDSEKTNVGFMLGLEENKKRVNFSIYTEAIKKITELSKLKDLLSILDGHWQKSLSALIDSFDNLALDIYVFGSVMWQYITKQQYIHPKSDIDLLWKPKTREELDQGLSILKVWMKKYSLKIDGEVILPCKNACSWKELLNDDEVVLVKNLHNIYLEKKEVFLSSLRK